MKHLLTGLTALFLSATASAEILTFQVEKGTSVIEISWSFEATGCSPSTNELSVLYSEDLDAYVTGHDIAYKEVDLSLIDRSYPPSMCQAQVTHTTVAKFMVTAEKSETIEVVVTDRGYFGKRNLSKVTPMVNEIFKKDSL